jgi:short-subunit dehydrogenase
VSCPGATATEFGQVAGNGESKLFKLGAMNARDVAAHAYHAMMRGKRMAIPGLKNKFGVQSLRVSPRGAVLNITAALNDGGRVSALPAARP